MKYFVFLFGFLVLIGFAGLFLSGNQAYGMWLPQSPEELFEQNETVFVGTVTSVNVLEFERSNTYHIEENGVSRIEIENYTQVLDEYTVDIEEFLKNPQTSNTITMLEATVGGVPGRSVSIGGFELGDRVLFYVPKLDGTNQYSPESFKIPKQCDANSVLEQSRVFLFNDFKMIQDGIEKNNNFTANKPIEFVYNKDMNTLEGKNFNVDITISKISGNDWETVIQENIHTESKPCEWTSTASWEFVPTAGRYNMWMHTSEGNNTGGDTTSSGFTVINDISPTRSVFPSHGFHAWKMPPLQQIKAGILSMDVQCKEGLVQVFKQSDNSPACVKPESVPKLIERGWATSYLDTYGTKSIFEVVKDDEIFDVEYTIKGGTIRDMVYVVDASSLLVTINSTGEGKLTLVLPRNLIDTTLDTCLTVDANPYDDRFFVLLDGEEIAYDEISVTIEKRILQIQFYDDTSNIEIIPICLI